MSFRKPTAADEEEDEEAYRARIKATMDRANRYKSKNALESIRSKAAKQVDNTHLAPDEGAEMDDEQHKALIETRKAAAMSVSAEEVRRKVKEDIKAEVPPPPGMADGSAGLLARR